MKKPTEKRLLEKIETLRAAGTDFSPSDLGYSLGMTTGEVTQIVRSIDDIYRKKPGAATRYGYQSSVWGFRNGIEG